MWSVRRLLYIRQTGIRFWILEVCEFRIWQLISTVFCPVFPRIVTKFRTELNLLSIDFVLGDH